MNDGIFRNTCPRNCFGSCGMLSHVKNGKLVKVTGDPSHGFTDGKLCAKGYAYTQFVYNPHRLKYPMLQSPRGSGNWRHITWDQAYEIIAEKMIQLKERYGSNLASGYNKYSGNLGLLHYATEGMFNSIGPHTKPFGNPCALTGLNALARSFGSQFSSVPEDMACSRLIVLWGANPAVTNVHQMKFIYEARRKGAILVVIDPIFTQTAKKADLYLQIKPGTDKWLALGLAKLILENGYASPDFLNDKGVGWREYLDFLAEGFTMEDVYEMTGIATEAIAELYSLYSTVNPAATWAGLGIQRNSHGNDSIEAITSLVAISGNLILPHAGLYFMHSEVEQFPNQLLHHQGPVYEEVGPRFVDISDYASNVLAFKEPPLKLLWIASRNIFTQDQNLAEWMELFDQLELIVTVDMYMTKTAKQSDLVLPATTHFEEEDLNVGYWHYWLGYNQKAIPAYYGAKSDLQIARELTTRLNQLSPGFSNFPAEKEPIDWIRGELTPKILDRYAIDSLEALMEKPHSKKEKPAFPSDTPLFSFFTPGEKKAMAESTGNSETGTDDYTLLTPQSLLKIHSQYEWVTWLNGKVETESMIEIPVSAARKHGLKNDEKIELYNENGSFVGITNVANHLPDTVVLTHQAGSNPINQIMKNTNQETPDSSSYFYDSVVKIRKWRESDV